MTRKKKARKVGSEGPAQYVERKLSKDDIAALARKRSNKRKGLKAGSRHSQASAAAQTNAFVDKDPRLGSKKPVALVVEQKPHPKSAAAKKERRLSAEQELALLEQDAQLNVLLDRLENGERLGAGLQAYVDEKLDRIEVLMQQLGLFEPEPENTSNTKKPKAARSDDELFNEFSTFKFDEE